MQIELKILNKQFYSEESKGILINPLPHYQSEGSAAIDLVCTEDVDINPGECKMIGTGIAIHIGSNFNYIYGKADIAGVIAPRSGLGHKGLILGNSLGILDEDYQGEILVSAWNRLESKENIKKENCYYCEYNSTSGCDSCGYKGFVVANFGEDNKISLKAGDRFAQLMFIPLVKVQFKVVEEFSNETDRGMGGFGSTGI